jgi:hypothetical protein
MMAVAAMRSSPCPRQKAKPQLITISKTKKAGIKA